MAFEKDNRTGRIGRHRYEKLTAMIETGKTAAECADELSVNPETVRKFARKRGLPMTKTDMTMENHPCWSGGRTLDRSGYILVRVRQDGPYGYLIRAIARRGNAGQDSSGYAPLHRIRMHQKLGRRLRKGEVVDHIDGDRQNNDPANLRVFSNNAAHLKATLKGRVPNWSPEGRAKMTGRPPNRRAADREQIPSDHHSRSGDQA